VEIFNKSFRNPYC